MVLMVFLSSRISPRASTLIFWVRSPRATAVVTWAMLRTCSVRLSAMKLTESVRSRQVPDTPGTTAWPPRRPSPAISRESLVTSAAKRDSCAMRPLTVLASVAYAPCSGRPSSVRVIGWERSPSATAPSTRSSSIVGRVRSSTRPLTLSTAVLQPPGPTSASTRSLSLPSWPTAARTRSSSLTSRWLRSAMSLNATASCAEMPSPCGTSRRRKLPSPRSRTATSSRSSAAASLWDSVVMCADPLHHACASHGRRPSVP